MKTKYVSIPFFSASYPNAWLTFLIEDFIVCELVCLSVTFHIDWDPNRAKDLFKDDFAQGDHRF